MGPRRRGRRPQLPRRRRRSLAGRAGSVQVGQGVHAPDRRWRTRRATRCGRAARGAEKHDDHRRGRLDVAGKGPDVPRRPALRRRLHDRASCRAPRSTTPSATSGTTARSGTATTPRPPSAASTKASVLPDRASRASSAGASCSTWPATAARTCLDMAETFTHEDLMACAEAQGAAIQKHDVLVIRTGLDRQVLQVRAARSSTTASSSPASPTAAELVQWFHDMEIPNLVTDTIANEVTDRPGVGRRPAAALRPDAQPRRHRSPRSPGSTTWPTTAPPTGSTPSSTPPRRSRSSTAPARR